MVCIMRGVYVAGVHIHMFNSNTKS